MNTINTTKNGKVNVTANSKSARPARRNNMLPINLLITLTAFAATMTGWGVLAAKDYVSTTAANTAVVAPVATTTVATTVAQALPTIEPLVSAGTTTQVAQVAQVAQVSTITKATTVKQATTAVRAAPRAVTTTRSSR